MKDFRVCGRAGTKANTGIGSLLLFTGMINEIVLLRKLEA